MKIFGERNNHAEADAGRAQRREARGAGRGERRIALDHRSRYAHSTIRDYSIYFDAQTTDRRAPAGAPGHRAREDTSIARSRAPTVSEAALWNFTGSRRRRE